MSKFFILIIALAAAGTIIRYTRNIEGTTREKISFLAKTSKQAVMGIKIPRYAGRHFVLPA